MFVRSRSCASLSPDAPWWQLCAVPLVLGGILGVTTRYGLMGKSEGRRRRIRAAKNKSGLGITTLKRSSFDGRLSIVYSIVTHLKESLMKFITVRDLRGRSGQVWIKLAQEREVVLTSNGKPIAILSAVSEDTLEESLTAVRRARAVAAVEKMQRQSVQAGTNSLSPREIASEIKAVRKARHR